MSMKLVATRVDYDETNSGKFKVSVSYHEGDAPDRLGQSADIVVYVSVNGRRIPEDVPAISTQAVNQARHLLRRILTETDEPGH